MKDKMYESSEAKRLWDAVRPIDAQELREAAKELLETIAKMAEAAGFRTRLDETSEVGPALEVKDPRLVTLDAWAALDADDLIYVGSRALHSKQAAKVEYDRASRAFVGTEDDEYLVPSPGEPRVRKRPSAAVLSAQLLEILKHRR
jgi:hypothetical protein